MAPETLDYANAPTPQSRWIRSLYKHSYAFVAPMMVFLNLFPGGTRGSNFGSGFTSELGWPIAHRREIYFVRRVVIDDHRGFLAVDAGIVVVLTVLFAVAARWYLRRVHLGKATSFSLTVPIAQGLFALYLVFACLAHVSFSLGN